jgi:hypothetical protein
MARRERDILEHAVHTVAEQAAKADDLVDEAIEVGHGRSDPLVTHAKMLRLELLKVKADLERELEDFSLNCSKCGLDVHWVSGLGATPGHWAHREPAPHGEPAVSETWLWTPTSPNAAPAPIKSSFASGGARSPAGVERSLT